MTRRRNLALEIGRVHRDLGRFLDGYRDRTDTAPVTRRPSYKLLRAVHAAIFEMPAVGGARENFGEVLYQGLASEAIPLRRLRAGTRAVERALKAGFEPSDPAEGRLAAALANGLRWRVMGESSLRSLSPALSAARGTPFGSERVAEHVVERLKDGRYYGLRHVRAASNLVVRAVQHDSEIPPENVLLAAHDASKRVGGVDRAFEIQNKLLDHGVFPTAPRVVRLHKHGLRAVLRDARLVQRVRTYARRSPR